MAMAGGAAMTPQALYSLVQSVESRLRGIYPLHFDVLLPDFSDLSVCSFAVSDYLVLVRFVVVSDCVLVRLDHV